MGLCFGALTLVVTLITISGQTEFGEPSDSVRSRIAHGRSRHHDALDPRSSSVLGRLCWADATPVRCFFDARHGIEIST
jgi:hypothetical protein